MDRLALNRMFKNGLMAGAALGLLLAGSGCRNQETRVPPMAHYSDEGMMPTANQAYPGYEAVGGMPAGTGYDSVGSPYASSGASAGSDYGVPAADANPYGSMAGAGGEDLGNPYATNPVSMPGNNLPEAGAGMGGYDAQDLNAGGAPAIPDDMPYMSPIPGPGN
jgi:hypothetical protein